MKEETRSRVVVTGTCGHFFSHASTKRKREKRKNKKKNKEGEHYVDMANVDTSSSVESSSWWIRELEAWAG